MARRFFIGLASGSSHFGVDAALVGAEGFGNGLSLRAEHFLHFPFSNEMRDLLDRVTADRVTDLRNLATLHRVLGETYSLAVRDLFQFSRLAPQQVLAIGCPGVSLWHDADGRYPATMNLGMVGVLAERSGLTVVSDFGSRDMALGGQGLPMPAYVDAILFQHETEHRVLVHLGTTASIVSLSPYSAPGETPTVSTPPRRDVTAFQAAPCTMLLDGLMRLLTNNKEVIDNGGKHAVQGRCLDSLLDRWMQNHFFLKRPPKSLPRWEFGIDFLNRAVEQARRLGGNLHDLLCTMTHFVAHAIADAIHRYLPARPSRIFLSGRGTRNGFLWHLLQQKLGAIPVEKLDALGVDATSRQAVGYAGLAALALDGIPVNLPGVTGASGLRLQGQFTPGTSANWARCLAWMSHLSSGPRSVAA